MDRSGSELDLPGFRFHPTEEELLDFYLRRMVLGKNLNYNPIGTIHLYRHDPWELPGLAKIGEREWYFFVPRDRRQSSGGRPNRTTDRGFWKATGSDRPIRSAADPKRLIGLKKTLVFYMGRAPRGSKTDWVMNEYRLPETSSSAPPPMEDIVLCKIYRKATSLRELEQRAAMEEDARAMMQVTGTVSVGDTVSSPDLDLDCSFPKPNNLDNGDTDELAKKEDVAVLLEEEEEEVIRNIKEIEVSTSASMVARPVTLPELQVPKYGTDQWTQVDQLWAQLRSPWMEQWSPYANLLNF